jgi:uncharacterized protein YjbI with pentapeptide repeats
MKPRWKLLRNIVGWGAFIFIVVQLILAGYSFPWTGFGSYILPNGDFVREKSLWDWMELLVIPTVLALGAFFLNRSERSLERQIAEERTKEDRRLADERAKLEREIATDRQQEAALQAYLDRMSELLVKENLQTTRTKTVRNVARTRTLTILRALDGRRKGELIKFLYEAGLINRDKPIINLVEADLREADLSNTNLRGAYLFGANLEGLNVIILSVEFTGQTTTLIDKKGTRYKQIEDVKFLGTNMKNAVLRGANLQGADLSDSDLSYADLRGADLRKAHIRRAEFEKSNINLEGTIMPDGTKHD